MFNILLWTLQILIALVFLYSGVCKSFLTIPKLVAIGQTGVEHLPSWLVRFIGISELAGAIGIICPWWLSTYPVLTPVAALCFAFIMPFAAVIHYKRKEPRNVLTNVIIFMLCMFTGVVRLWQL